MSFEEIVIVGYDGNMDYNDTTSTLSDELSPLQQITEIDREIIISYLNNKDSLNIIPSSISFDKIGEGNSGSIFKFTYNDIMYGVKKYKNQDIHIPKIQIPESDYYIQTNIISNSDKTHFYGIFLYLQDYITLEKYITHNPIYETVCYHLDMNRWTIVKNLITLIKNIHSIHIYHRDIHPSNIMIHNSISIVNRTFSSAVYCKSK